MCVPSLKVSKDQFPRWRFEQDISRSEEKSPFITIDNLWIVGYNPNVNVYI